MRHKLGNAIAQYGIIIVLVALALIPILFGLGGTIVQQLTNFSNSFGGSEVTNNDGGSTTTPITNPKDHTLPKVPISGGDDNNDDGNESVEISCKKDSCTIDFGGYQLTGIPENFGEYIESSGSSGGTDKLVALLEQIANSPELSPDQKNLVEQLANKGHQLAAIEKIVETETQSLIDNGSGPTSNFVENGSVLNNRKSEFSDLLTSTSNSLSSDPELKDLVNLLGTEISNLAIEMSRYHSIANSSCSDADDCASNQLQGAEVPTSGYTESLDSIINPNTSNTTDLDSAIICIAGGDNDTGTQCN